MIYQRIRIKSQENLSAFVYEKYLIESIKQLILRLILLLFDLVMNFQIELYCATMTNHFIFLYIV